jgi:signal transduction histidine kinase/DNA-binding response OmpR family regulator
MAHRIIAVAIDFEQDVVAARQRARQIAGVLGFDGQDQARIATAVSEIARNALRYAGRGDAEFALEGDSAPQVLIIRVRDRGPGIADLQRILDGRYTSSTGMGLGIVGARRLMDQCDIVSAPGQGTEVVMKKILPARSAVFGRNALGRLAGTLAARSPATPFEEIQQQNRELIRAMDELRQRQDELMSVNRELEDTNRGVVALYAELDEKAGHLRRADEMKSRFLSNMSHEFRTPLHSIRGLVRLLLDREDGPLTAEQEKQLAFIQKAAEGLTELVDDLLDLAKIEAGKVVVHPTEFSVDNLFSALRGMLRPLLVSDSVSLRFEESGELPLMHTDEAKVSQILRNFISNALKFTERGEVRITASASADGATVTFSVADTGIGIDEQDQKNIFEEFTQVPGPLQKRVKGTGLGLPLCRNLATLLGGEVWLQSARGQGSTFSVRIPVVFRDVRLAEERVEPFVPALEPGKIHVLLVEDEPEVRLFYEKILRGTPYQVVPASTLREARDLVARATPAAIVLDILLRGEDSWRWLGELKNDALTRAIPVLVATTVEDERKAYALGADAYLRKPLDRAALVGQLDRFLGRRILLIEDDPATRYTLKKLLDSANCHVVEAADGTSGLEAARVAKPELILLDLGLPDITGEEVLERLSAGAETAAIPVVIATARDLSAAERTALNLRARGVLSKRDMNKETLGAMLRAVQTGQRMH